MSQGDRQPRSEAICHAGRGSEMGRPVGRHSWTGSTCRQQDSNSGNKLGRTAGLEARQTIPVWGLQSRASQTWTCTWNASSDSSVLGWTWDPAFLPCSWVTWWTSEQGVQTRGWAASTVLGVSGQLLASILASCHMIRWRACLDNLPLRVEVSRTTWLWVNTCVQHRARVLTSSRPAWSTWTYVSYLTVKPWL